MVRRFKEQTLHTGRSAYMLARGLTGLDYPVLVRADDYYEYVVALYPVEDEAGLYYRVWAPTESMHYAAAHVFGKWYTGNQPRVDDDRYIWEGIRRIQRALLRTRPEIREQGRQYMKRVARYLSDQYQEVVPATSLGAAAEFYRHTDGIVFHNHFSASFAGATLLLMLGVPRERVAVFGMYYQDPMVYYRENSDWRGGFMFGTPYYTVMGVYVAGRWIPVDFTVLPDINMAEYHIPAHPSPYVRSSFLGEQDGVRMEIDYRHPYTMIFAPTAPIDDSTSPLLSRIPLLELD